jgi:Domain of unknown function (DUF4190)
VTDTGPGEPPDRRLPDAPPPEDRPPDEQPTSPQTSGAQPSGAHPSGAQPSGAQPSGAWTAPQSPPPGGATTVPPPPGAAPPGTGYGWTPPPPGTPGYGPRKTNTLAIVSLVLGIAQFVICPVIGAIGAIITGHIAQGQIKRSQGAESGRGMARAGTILGYVGLALLVLALVAGAVVLGVFGDDITRASLRSDGREFVNHAKAEASASGGPLRDPETLENAYLQTDVNDDDTSMRLADGTSIRGASEADWERNNWQVQLHGSLIKDGDVCVQVPDNTGESPVVTNGKCQPVT